MIEQLFGSKTRVKLLSLFFNNPGRPFYVREITRKIDEQINSVRRELANLLTMGIVSSDGNNNRLYYEVSPKYEYYEQLRSIFTSLPVETNSVMEETREEDQIIKALRLAGSIDYAFLSGSFVLGSNTNVDIFVVGDVNKARLAKSVSDLEKSLGRELNYTTLTQNEYQYRLGLSDRFVTGLLEAKKIVVIDGQEKSLAHADVSFGEQISVPVSFKTAPRGQQNSRQ